MEALVLSVLSQVPVLDRIVMALGGQDRATNLRLTCKTLRDCLKIPNKAKVFMASIKYGGRPSRLKNDGSRL